jgi:hypothetical protein
MTNPTHGDYDIAQVDSIETLKSRLNDATDVRDLSHILADYISWGNSKIAKSVAVFNMNSATDCPNAKPAGNGETDTGLCQVDFGDCYAHKSENVYPNTLPYRRRQEYLWDRLSAQQWAGAFKCLLSRKRNEVTAIRFSEAGDFRNQQDIQKVDQIAQMLATEGIDVYTYSASHKLDWSNAENFTVNQSNNLADYGDRIFTALPEGHDLPDGTVWCPHSLEKKEKGVTSDEAIKCGDCRLCIDEDGPDVAVHLH